MSYISHLYFTRVTRAFGRGSLSDSIARRPVHGMCVWKWWWWTGILRILCWFVCVCSALYSAEEVEAAIERARPCEGKRLGQDRYDSKHTNTHDTVYINICQPLNEVNISTQLLRALLSRAIPSMHDASGLTSPLLALSVSLACRFLEDIHLTAMANVLKRPLWVMADSLRVFLPLRHDPEVREDPP